MLSLQLVPEFEIGETPVSKVINKSAAGFVHFIISVGCQVLEKRPPVFPRVEGNIINQLIAFCQLIFHPASC